MARCFPLVVTLALSGCMAEEPGDEVGERSAALAPVTWTDLVGVSATVGGLTKTAPETLWNAGAVSVQTLAGDGFVEFTSDENTTDKQIGLSSGNGGPQMSDIDFAVRLKANGAAMVYEGGVALVPIGSYSPGIVFRVQAEDGVVTYWRNGVLKYTSALAPTFPLLVDTSLRTPGATLTDVKIEPIDFWTAPVGVSVDGRDITKTAPEDLFNAGAASLETIASGDGYVEFRVADATTSKAAGLSNGNGGAGRSDIDYAIFFAPNGGVQVIEFGTTIGVFGSYRPEDVFRVQVESGVVSYLQNRVPFYTSAAAPTYPLVLDTSLRTPGTSILDARLVAGYVTDDCAPLEDTMAVPPVYDMAASGDLLVLGQRQATPPVAKVYRQIDGVWTFEQTLDNPDPTSGFAGQVATDGETIAVGIGGLQGEPGSVQVYRQDTGGVWLEDIRIDPCPASQPGVFEFAVRGDVLLAAESVEDRVQVYRRVDGAWGLDGFLTPTGGSILQSFGSSLAIGGDRAFIGAALDDPGGTVYMFRYNPANPEPPQPPSCASMHQGKWRQKLRLVPPADHGYSSVDANKDGTRLLIADRNDAHLFEASGGVWSETTRLVPYPDESVDGVLFGGPAPDGGSVALIGDSVFAELADGWAQIALLDENVSRSAVAGSAVFRQILGAVDVYGLDPVCLAE